MPTTPTTPGRPAGTAYRERLTPSQFWWFAAIAIGASLGLVALPLAGQPGLVFGAMLGAALGIAVLVVTSARVEVGDGTLRAGRAAMELAHVGTVELLDAERMADLRGRGIDPRAYHCQRAWMPAGVKVQVVDPADPTPYWLISSRQPAALADALKPGRTTH